MMVMLMVMKLIMTVMMLASPCISMLLCYNLQTAILNLHCNQRRLHNVDPDPPRNQDPGHDPRGCQKQFLLAVLVGHEGLR